MEFGAKMRQAETVELAEGLELTEEDLGFLQTNRGTSAPEIKRVRHSHQMLARLLAIGVSPKECAARLNISASRISILQNDPTFKGLLQVYHEKQDEITHEILENFREVGLNAIQEIRDRLLEEPEKFQNGQLLDLATAALDRLGHGPTAKVAIAHVDIQELRRNASVARQDQITFRSNDRETEVLTIEVDPAAAEGVDV